MTIQKNEIVTVSMQNSNSSNTFIVDTVEDDSVLLFHPLAKGILFRFPKDRINKVSANIKDPTERCLDYANANKTLLDHNTVSDLESLCIFFSLKRKLTPRQKQTLANVCGNIATYKFSNDVKDAMEFITHNVSMLDEFNLMWFNNFKGLFEGRQPITSKKQRGAIFNIAGYILAELQTPIGLQS